MNSLIKKTLFLYFLLILIVFCFFLPCLQANFINFDDPQHFLQNRLVSEFSVSSIKDIFVQTINGIYVPLTTLSFAVEHYFFGFNPFFFHLDNLLLHMANVILVFMLAQRMGLSIMAAFLTALIFGIHPMKVESVAWVTERKDVLYAFFYLLALHQYWSYLKSRSIKNYLTTLVLGLLSMLAKPMALSLPLILFLFDWFYGRRWDRYVLFEKIPFFLYTAEIGMLSYVFNMRNPINDITQAILIWVWSFDFYIWKFLWPFNVSFIYSLPYPITWTYWPYLLSVGIFLLLMGVLIRWRSQRWLIFAFGYYFISIFFLLRFDDQVDYTVVSDRFMYLSSLGFCLLLGSWLERIMKRFFLPFVCMLVIAWGIVTFRQCYIWGDSLIFWNEIVRQYPAISSAYLGRGSAYGVLGDRQSAISDYSKAIALAPMRDDAYFNRGVVLALEGKYAEALVDLNKAVELNPENKKACLWREIIEKKKSP